jgi:hypothetical protein
LLFAGGNAWAGSAAAPERTFTFREIKLSTRGPSEFSWETGKLVMSGGVKLTAGEIVLESEKMTVHLTPRTFEQVDSVFAEGKVKINGTIKRKTGEQVVVKAQAEVADYKRLEARANLRGSPARVEAREPATGRTALSEAREIEIDLKKEMILLPKGGDLVWTIPEKEAAPPEKP